MYSLYEEFVKSGLEINIHYIKRYLRFIETYSITSHIDKDVYVERHHILPRSLFPQYECFNKNPWNEAVLPIRAHYIAHLLLYKALPNTIEMWNALWFMVHNIVLTKDHSANSKLYEEFRTNYINMLRGSIIITNGHISKRILASEFKLYKNKGWRRGRSDSAIENYSKANSGKNNPAYGRTDDKHPMYGKFRGMCIKTGDIVIVDHTDMPLIDTTNFISDNRKTFYKITKDGDVIYLSSSLFAVEYYSNVFLGVTGRTFRNIRNKPRPDILIEEFHYTDYNNEPLLRVEPEYIRKFFGLD